MTRSRNHLFPAILAVALVAAAAWPVGALGRSAPAATGSALTPAGKKPDFLREIGFDQRLGEQVPSDLPFVDASGHRVKLGDYFGKRPVVLALVYFKCPMLCPMALSGLASSLKSLTFDVGKDFDVLVVSFDPHETPDLASARREEVLHQYGRSGTDRGWHFLTGGQDAIHRLTQAVGFRYKYLPEKGEFAHASGIVVLTPGGRVARYFFGIEYSPKDLRLGMVEASGGKIGTPVDTVLLYCFHYDPQTGRYSATALGILRLAGVLTVLALTLGIVVMVRREKRQTRTDPRAV